jgi:putative flippase GtrA
MAVPQVVRYVLVGLLAVAVHYAVLNGLVELTPLHKLPASIAGFCVAIPVNYSLQHRWVFRSGSAHAMALPRYIMITAFGLIINAVAFAAMLDLGVPYLLAQAAAIILVTSFNFMANRSFTFAVHSGVGS